MLCSLAISNLSEFLFSILAFLLGGDRDLDLVIFDFDFGMSVKQGS